MQFVESQRKDKCGDTYQKWKCKNWDVFKSNQERKFGGSDWGKGEELGYQISTEIAINYNQYEF